MTGGPAVLAGASAGSADLEPVMLAIRTPGRVLSLAVTVSPAPSSANPIMSNPQETLDTDAGANAVTSFPISALVIRYSDDVREHSRGRDLGPCARAFDDDRLIGAVGRRQRDDNIAP